MVYARNSVTVEIARVGGHYAVQGLLRLTYSGTNRKPMCDFVLEGLLSNTYIPSRTICCFVAISLSLLTRVSLTNSFSETSENIAISHISVKARLFGLHFCRRRYGPIFSHLCNSLPLPQSCRIR